MARQQAILAKAYDLETHNTSPPQQVSQIEIGGMSTPEEVQINSVLAKSLRVGCPGDVVHDGIEITFDRLEVEIGTA